jgi:uncharacterized Zn finger protein
MKVADIKARAEKKMAELREAGEDIQPVGVKGRLLARKFWGKHWCSHLEHFSDYIDRLPAGRSYLRNQAVCDLRVTEGEVNAQVMGAQLYQVWVRITPLEAGKWADLKKESAGKIGSLIELLQGKLSEEVMSLVTAPQDGLLPLQGEITYSCDCLDYADMCKHVAAVLYGIGIRLDTEPELLFLLRGVNHEELVTLAGAAEQLTGSGSRRARRRTISPSDLEHVFGVELLSEDEEKNAN